MVNMRLKSILTLIGISLTTQAFAASILQVPDHIQLLAINGKPINYANTLTNNYTRYKIDDGVNQLTIRYVQVFDQAAGGVKSENIIFTTPNLIPNESYQLNLLEIPETLAAAQAFAKYPKIALFDKNQQIVARHLSYTRDATEPTVAAYTRAAYMGSNTDVIDLSTRQSNVLPSRNNLPYEGESSVEELKYNSRFVSANKVLSDGGSATAASNIDVPGSTKIKTSISPQSKVNFSSPSAYPSPNAKMDQELIQLWNQASFEERRRFMNWLATPLP